MRRVSITVFVLPLILLTSVASAQSNVTDEVMNSDLRDLLLAASEDGWIEFVPNTKTMNEGIPSVADKRSLDASDCAAFAGSDPNGLFIENPLADRELNALLPKLLEGESLTDVELNRFVGLGQCGSDFAIWEHLAVAQSDELQIDPEPAIAALYSHTVYIRERAGLTMAIAAGLSGDKATMRRFADMLQDAGLHGTPAFERDPRHILLDALLLEGHDPNGARQRYEWLSERDGSEQIIAIDRLTELGSSAIAAKSLDRMTEDLSFTDTSQLAELKLKAVFESGQILNVSKLLKSGSLSAADFTNESLTALEGLTRSALLGDNINEKITALDLYSEFPDYYETQDFEEVVERAFGSIIGASVETVKEVEITVPTDPSHLASKSLKKVNSENANNFISDISEDLMKAQKVLSNG